MPTKRFVWKDRDTAALDLIQLVYHAPQYISQQALHILSAIGSDAIIPDLQAIVLDSERPYWERVYALRALAKTSRQVYFPDLLSVTNEQILKREEIIAKAGNTIATLHEQYFPDDILPEIIAFAANQPSNRNWLLNRLEQAADTIGCSVFSSELSFQLPHDMLFVMLHRLIAILDAHPTLLTLFSVHQIYQYHDSDDQAKKFLQKYFNVIVELAVTAISSNDSQYEIPWTIPLEWIDLKTAIIRMHPSFEEKFRAAENYYKARHLHFEKERQTGPAYKESAIWRKLEALYDHANKGDHRAKFKLYRMALDNDLEIPVRAAATYFFGRLEVQTRVIDKLAILVQRSNDLWNDYYSPIRFEAGKTLFEIGTPEAWETLIDAFFANPSNMLEDFLWDWIQNLTDTLSGVINTYEGSEQSVEMRWFRTLVKES